MSTAEQTDKKDEQKSEHQYLTLADKKPSLIRETGNESTSTRTVSTRELSVNLQRTRDGLINLNKKKGGNDDGLSRTQGSFSGDESEDLHGIGGRSVRDKKSITDDGMNGSSLYDKDGRRRLGQHKEFGSKVDANREGYNMNSGEEQEQYEKGFNQKIRKSGENFNKKDSKLFKSQKQKKDDPLITRIFIDAFLPTLEGNRIFPMFNYRCTEKIERTSSKFYERNRKGLNKQLAAVSSTEKCVENETSESCEGSIEDSCSTVRKIRKVGQHGSVQEIRIVEESGIEQQIEKKETLQTIKDLRGVYEENSELEKTKKLHRKEDLLTRGELQVQGVEQDGESQKVNEVGKVLENIQKIEEVFQKQIPATTTNEIVSSPDNQTKTKLDERRDQANEKVAHADKSSTEDDTLLQRVLRTLVDNEELVDFLCEKVISKIAARNDFCSPNCKNTCGGLNKPSA